MRWGLFVVQGTVYIIIAIMLDTKKIHGFKGKDSRIQTVPRTQLDERPDVIEHRNQTNANWGQDNLNHLIKGQGLKKVYPNGVAAVNGNTFQVAKGEVFGLLGPNGAGKSSMFNLMTMDFKRSEGEVKIMDTNIDELNVT